MNKPLISVIMCAYNPNELYLDESVNSILKQTFKDFELIIINDGSDCFPNLKSFSDPRIVIKNNATNMGISFSRNVGLALARGKYIAIMDSDDVAEPQRLEYEYNFMEHNLDCVACGTWFRQFGEKQSDCKRNIDNSNLYKARLLFDNEPTLLDPSSMIRKKVLDDNQIKYDESMRSGMDYMMWVILSEYGEIHNVKKILVNYRTHPGQITKKGFKYFDWNVKKYQLSKLGLDVTQKDCEMLMEPLNSMKYSLKDYRLFLDKIINYNECTNYFEKDAIKKVTDYQWYRKILNSNNIFYLFKGFLTTKKHKLLFVKAVLRHFGLFKRMDNFLNEAR